MKAIPLVGVAALALAACGAEDGANTNTTNTEVTTITEDDAGTTDPALTDLNMGADAGEVGQAVNQTDSQANLGSTVEGAAGTGENQN